MVDGGRLAATARLSRRETSLAAGADWCDWARENYRPGKTAAEFVLRYAEENLGASAGDVFPSLLRAVGMGGEEHGLAIVELYDAVGGGREAVREVEGWSPEVLLGVLDWAMIDDDDEEGA
jgi:hypothetical protein